MGLQNFTSGTGGFDFLQTLKWANLNYDWYSMVPIEDHTFFCTYNLLAFHQHIHLGYIFSPFFHIRHMQNQLHFCICRSLKLKISFNIEIEILLWLYVMMLITPLPKLEHTPCLHLRNNTIQTYTPNRKNTNHCPLSQTHLFESKPNLESSRSST